MPCHVFVYLLVLHMVCGPDPDRVIYEHSIYLYDTTILWRKDLKNDSDDVKFLVKSEKIN